MPNPDAGVNVGTVIHPVICELNNYERWRCAQTAVTTPSVPKKNVWFDNFLTHNASTDNTAAPLPTISEGQEIVHHSNQRLEGCM